MNDNEESTSDDFISLVVVVVVVVVVVGSFRIENDRIIENLIIDLNFVAFVAFVLDDISRNCQRTISH